MRGVVVGGIVFLLETVVIFENILMEMAWSFFFSFQRCKLFSVGEC